MVKSRRSIRSMLGTGVALVTTFSISAEASASLPGCLSLPSIAKPLISKRASLPSPSPRTATCLRARLLRPSVEALTGPARAKSFASIRSAENECAMSFSAAASALESFAPPRSIFGGRPLSPVARTVAIVTGGPSLTAAPPLVTVWIATASQIGRGASPSSVRGPVARCTIWARSSPLKVVAPVETLVSFLSSLKARTAVAALPVAARPPLMLASRTSFCVKCTWREPSIESPVISGMTMDAASSVRSRASRTFGSLAANSAARSVPESDEPATSTCLIRMVAVPLVTTISSAVAVPAGVAPTPGCATRWPELA